MKLHLFSKKTWIAAAAFVALMLALVSYGACGAAKAAEPTGEYFAAVSAIYQQQLGAGAGMGYQFKKSGVMLLGQLTYTYQDAITGTGTCRIGCQTCAVPWTTGEVGSRGVAFTVAFPIRKAAKK